MLLAEVNQKMEVNLDKIMSDLNKVGFKKFFKQTDAIKRHLRLKDSDIEALTKESYVLCQHRQWAQAIEAIIYLILCNPLHSFHYLRLGTVLLQMGKFEDAIQIFQMAHYLNTKDPRPLLYVGDCYLELDHPKEAKKAFACCLEIARAHPEHKEVYNLASQALKEIQYL